MRFSSTVVLSLLLSPTSGFVTPPVHHARRPSFHAKKRSFSATQLQASELLDGISAVANDATNHGLDVHQFTNFFLLFPLAAVVAVANHNHNSDKSVIRDGDDSAKSASWGTVLAAATLVSALQLGSLSVPSAYAFGDRDLQDALIEVAATNAEATDTLDSLIEKLAAASGKTVEQKKKEVQTPAIEALHPDVEGEKDKALAAFRENVNYATSPASADREPPKVVEKKAEAPKPVAPVAEPPKAATPIIPPVVPEKKAEAPKPMVPEKKEEPPKAAAGVPVVPEKKEETPKAAVPVVPEKKEETPKVSAPAAAPGVAEKKEDAPKAAASVVPEKKEAPKASAPIASPVIPEKKEEAPKAAATLVPEKKEEAPKAAAPAIAPAVADKKVEAPKAPAPAVPEDTLKAAAPAATEKKDGTEKDDAPNPFMSPFFEKKEEAPKPQVTPPAKEEAKKAESAPILGKKEETKASPAPSPKANDVKSVLGSFPAPDFSALPIPKVNVGVPKMDTPQVDFQMPSLELQDPSILAASSIALVAATGLGVAKAAGSDSSDEQPVAGPEPTPKEEPLAVNGNSKETAPVEAVDEAPASVDSESTSEEEATDAETETKSPPTTPFKYAPPTPRRAFRKPPPRQPTQRLPRSRSPSQQMVNPVAPGNAADLTPLKPTDIPESSELTASDLEGLTSESSNESVNPAPVNGADPRAEATPSQYSAAKQSYSPMGKKYNSGGSGIGLGSYLDGMASPSQSLSSYDEPATEIPVNGGSDRASADLSQPVNGGSHYVYQESQPPSPPSTLNGAPKSYAPMGKRFEPVQKGPGASSYLDGVSSSAPIPSFAQPPNYTGEPVTNDYSEEFPPTSYSNEPAPPAADAPAEFNPPGFKRSFSPMGRKFVAAKAGTGGSYLERMSSTPSELGAGSDGGSEPQQHDYYSVNGGAEDDY